MGPPKLQLPKHMVCVTCCVAATTAGSKWRNAWTNELPGWLPAGCRQLWGCTAGALGHERQQVWCSALHAHVQFPPRLAAWVNQASCRQLCHAPASCTACPLGGARPRMWVPCLQHAQHGSTRCRVDAGSTRASQVDCWLRLLSCAGPCLRLLTPASLAALAPRRP